MAWERGGAHLRLMKPLIALMDSHPHAAKSLGLLLSDNGWDSVIETNALGILLKARDIARLGLIIIEEWNLGGGLAEALALRTAVGRLIPIVLLSSGFDVSPHLEEAIPSLLVIKTPVAAEQIVTAVKQAMSVVTPVNRSSAG